MVAVVRDRAEGTAALEQAASGLADAAPSSGTIVCVGDILDTESQDGFLRGHGTQVVDGKLVATVCGVVQHVNQLVTVKPMKSRYVAEIGDVVVGRVASIGGKRWNMDIGTRAEAGLQLSAVNLPGGAQRRRTAADELNMRTVFEEGDLVSAEIQSFFGDGSMALHTRSSKYGKLRGGVLVNVPCMLVRRQKAHFHTLPQAKTAIIFGCNGWIWISAMQESAETADAPGPVDRETRASVVRHANAVRALAELHLPIYLASVTGVAEQAESAGISLSAMLDTPFLCQVAEAEARKRGSMDTS